MSDVQNDLRNCAVDVYRMLLAFGIVWLHVGSTAEAAWPTNVLHFCVPAFAIITGYFGARFKVSKVLRLYTTAGVCLLALWLLRIWAGVEHEALDLSHWWFLHAYVIMITLAPFVDALFEQAKESGGVKKVLAAVVPLWIVVYGWSWLVGFDRVAAVLPTANGLCGFSFLTLLAAYSVGRVIRVFELGQRLQTKIVVLVALTSFSVSSVAGNYLAGYHCPVSIALAASSFLLFLRLRIPRPIGRVAVWFAPSMFAVYLLHFVIPISGDGAPRAFISYWLQIVGSGVLLPVVAIIVFLAALLLDMPRRIALRFFKRQLNTICSWCDWPLDIQKW